MKLALLLLASLLMLGAGPRPENPKVVIETSLGNIEVEIYADKAPVSAKNFLRYVDAGRYTGGVFHRTVTMKNQPGRKVKIEVIQGGVNPEFAKRDFTPIALERTNKTGVHHLDGTISMARDGADSATSDFFICVGKQPELDYEGKRNPDGQGFAAFGRVTKGMDVVRKIQKSPAEEQSLKPPIVIVSIKRMG